MYNFKSFRERKTYTMNIGKPNGQHSPPGVSQIPSNGTSCLLSPVYPDVVGARLPVPPLRRLTMQLDSGQRRNHAHDECVAGTALQILFTLPRFYSRRTTFVIDQFERSSITRRRYTSAVMLPHSRREILRHPNVQLHVLQRSQDVYDEHSIGRAHV